MRVPVVIRTNAWVPPKAAAWVPLKRTIHIRSQHANDERLLAHELQHVLQAEQFSWPLAYVMQWVRSGFNYSRMPFEVQARQAVNDPLMRVWARDLISQRETEALTPERSYVSMIQEE